MLSALRGGRRQAQARGPGRAAATDKRLKPPAARADNGEVGSAGIRGRVVAVAAACLGVLFAGAASASASTAAGSYEFPEFTPSSGSFERMSTRPVGDMTGDGIGEIAVAVGARFTPDAQDSIWVKRGDGSGEGTAAATTAFRVVAPVDLSRQAIAGISDLNGDGRSELAVSDGYDLFVVFGRNDGATVDLASLGNAGFRITNANVTANEHLLGPGDLNGDGQGEIAFASFGKAQIFFPPDDPAGQTFDAAGGGPLFETLTAAGSPTFGAPGNLDSDSADELVVVAGNAGTGADGLAAAVLDFNPGGSSALEDIATAGRGSVYRWPKSYGAQVIGDINGDGRRDLSVSSGGSTFLAFLGGRGIDREVADPQPGKGKLLDTAGRDLTDVGDVDRDGKDDVIDSQRTWLTGLQDMNDPDEPWPTEYNRFANTRITPVEAIPDETGDGLPELLTSLEHHDSAFATTKWTVQRLDSSALAPIELTKPIIDDSGEPVWVILHGVARFTPAQRTSLTAPAVGASVKGGGASFGGGSVNPATGKFEMSIPAEMLSSAADQNNVAQFRVEIRDDNVPVAVSQLQSITIDFDPGDYFYNLIEGDAEDDTLPGTPEPDKIKGLGGDDKLLGRGAEDRLIGGPGSDRLRGARGDDTLIGGRGSDVLAGGPGADVLNCGKGRDLARNVGRNDKTKGCERIKRKVKR